MLRLDLTPDSEAAECEQGNNQQLLHSADPSTSIFEDRLRRTSSSQAYRSRYQFRLRLRRLRLLGG
jgi:hypothetical protein